MRIYHFRIACYRLIALMFVSFLFSSCGLTWGGEEPPTPTPPLVSALVEPTPVASPTQPTAFSLSACTGDVSKPANAVEVHVVHGPDVSDFMQEIAHRFNCAYASGFEPGGQSRLAASDPLIYVTTQEVASGEAAERLVNTVRSQAQMADEDRLMPTLYIPTSRLWLSLVNAQSGQMLFDVEGAPASALSPVVLAIWESRLRALQEHYPGKALGWRELLPLFQAANGWQSIGLPQHEIGYGHTNPYISSTGLSAWVGEFYAAARYCAGQDAQQALTLELVEDKRVQSCVQAIEKTIKHYSATTTVFRDYIARGPEYVSIVPLEENDLILINEGKTSWGKPPEKLIGLYPSDGTFVNERPLAIPNADWVSREQKWAAEQLIAYILSPEIQSLAIDYEFRPADSTIPLTERFGVQNGVDPAQPQQLLQPPSPVVLNLIQQQWRLIKKQADIVLLLDVSGSMNDAYTIKSEHSVPQAISKLQQAKLAAQSFLQEQSNSNKLQLVQFSSSVQALSELHLLEEKGVRESLLTTVTTLTADGKTALYDALIETIQQITRTADASRIQAIIVISDGQDTVSSATVSDVEAAIHATQAGRTPVLVIPVAYAYGPNDDINPLVRIASAARTKVVEGDVTEIQRLLQEIGGYF